MSEELDTAERYRLHAEELRVMAEDKHGLENRKVLLGIAISYEKMAGSLEAIDATNTLLRKTGSGR